MFIRVAAYIRGFVLFGNRPTVCPKLKLNLKLKAEVKQQRPAELNAPKLKPGYAMML
jgi:hypothetical protein